MHFLVRIALGFALGAAVLAAFAFTVGPAWWAVAVAAVLAPVGFLGSFFLWTADRPEEGYEQVLFDRPNTIVSGVLGLVLVGAGLGSAWALGGEDPADAAFATQRDAIGGLAAAFQADADAFRSGEMDADPVTVFADHIAAIEEAYATLDAAPLRESDHEALGKVLDALFAAADAMDACVAGTESACVDARIFMDDHRRAVEALGAA